MIGIYAIENRLSKRVYVGRSTDILGRWRQHLQMLEKGHHHSFKLQSDYDELGIKHFSFRILELCEEDQLEEREIYWITKYNAETDGYNMTDKAYKPPSVLDSENRRLKEENRQLKEGNEKLKNRIRALIDKVKQLKTENVQIKEEKDEKEKEIAQLRESMNLPTIKEDDELYDQAYSLVVKTRIASVSMLQRQLRIGYTRAARLIDMLEKNGVIGPYQGSAPREVLIDLEEFEEESG